MSLSRARLFQPRLAQRVILGFALLIVAGSVALDLYLERGHIIAREQDRLLATTLIVEENLNQNLSALNEALDGLRRDPIIRRPSPALNERLKIFSDAMPSVRTLLVLDASGTVIGASRTGLEGKNFHERAYFQTVRQQPDSSTLYVSAPFRTALDVFAINVVRMVSGPDGEFAGIISATLDPQYFNPLLASVRYTPDMRTTLVHQDGALFLTVPDDPLLIGKNLARPDTQFTRHRQSGQAATVLTDRLFTTGDERILAQRNIAPAGLKMDKALVIAANRRIEEVFAPWRRDALLRTTMVLLLSLAASLALTAYQRRQSQFERIATAAARAQADSERFLRTLADNIPGMVAYWDADLRCGFANQAYREWFGKTAQEMNGIHNRDLIGEERFRANEMHIRATLNGARQQFQRSVPRADGQTHHIWTHYVPDIVGRDESRQVRGFFVLITDITELKTIEKQLEIANQQLRQRTAEAEAANLAKTGFLAHMSHEIRTPMSAVLGLLHLLQRTELTPHQRSYAEKAESAGRSLLEILNDILDLSKIEAGCMELEQAPFPLDQLLYDLSTLLEALVAHRDDLLLRIERGPNLPEAVVGDALRLRQILTNLASNAIKFTPAGEVVLHINARPADANRVELEFIVSDTGIGIAQDVMPRLFAGYSQAEASTSRRYGGTGLGLTISQRLAHLMGSDLQVRSTQGKGSKFSFTVNLPLANTSPAARPAPALPRPNPDSPRSLRLEGLRLLVVEDNLINQLVAREMLKAEGAEVEVVGGGIAGVDRALHGDPPFDAVLMDIQMPDLDGLAATRELRQHAQLAALPIIAMTANVLPAEREACLAAGMNDHITKPIEIEHLVTTLRRYCPQAGQNQLLS